jgi:hypothetical protein
MASAETVIVERQIVLSLNNSEALTLAVVLSHVAGSPRFSYRGDAESILNALTSTGINWRESKQFNYSSGHIQFEDTLEE